MLIRGYFQSESFINRHYESVLLKMNYLLPLSCTLPDTSVRNSVEFVRRNNKSLLIILHLWFLPNNACPIGRYRIQEPEGRNKTF